MIGEIYDGKFETELYSDKYRCMLRVIDYPNIRKWVYYINEDGTVIYSKLQRDKCIRSRPDKNGYLYVMLQAEDCDQSILVHVHRLVMFTYGSKPPVDMIDPTVDHIDSNRLNNHISNLQWLERRDNSLKATTNLKGINNPRSTITENVAKAIIYDLQQGILDCKQIARKFNVSYDVVRNIKTGSAWSYLTKDLDIKINHKTPTVSDDVKIEIAKDMVSGNFTDKQLAAKYGVTTDIIRNIKYKRGINDKELLKDFTFDIKQCNRLDKSIIHEIKVKMITTDIRNCDIMRMYGISKSNVENIRHWLQRHPEFSQDCFGNKIMSPNIDNMPPYIYAVNPTSCTDVSDGIDPYHIVESKVPIIKDECKDYVFDPSSKLITPFDI